MKGIVILLLVGCISYVHGLECYSCIYHKNMPNDWFDLSVPSSDKNCEKKPKNPIKCPDELSIEQTHSGLLKHKFGKTQNVNITTGGKVETSQALVPFCYKFHIKAGNKEAVERGCDIYYENYPDTCEIDQGSDPLFGGSFEAKECLCRNDKCNGAEVFQMSTFLAVIALVVIHGIC